MTVDSPDNADGPERSDSPEPSDSLDVSAVLASSAAADAADASGALDTSEALDEADVLDDTDVETLDLEPDELDGHTIDELADYLDAGMNPADPSIDDSPACQNAIEAIVRLRMLSHELFESEALDEPERDEAWITDILEGITMEAHSGRSIPLRSSTQAEHIVLTEGAVRAIVRRAGDGVDGIVVGRVGLSGDIETVGAPVGVRVTASIVWGHPIQDAAERVRTAVSRELLRHTELAVTEIDVVISNVAIGRQPQRGIEAS